MMDVKTELLRLSRTFKESQIPYAACGGVAMAVHGFPRATKDVDLIVCAEDLAAVRTAVRPLGYSVNGGFQTFQEGKETEMKLWRISRVVEDELWTIDFLIVTDFLRDVWEGRITIEHEGDQITVVSADGLRKMKELSGRPQDLVDLENLNDPDV
tara:strand:- start:4879 stop:5343 length:465 start_codon:yes stop_codon:yes gene_type:complete